MFTKNLFVVALLSIAAGMTACGGGSSSSNPAPEIDQKPNFPEPDENGNLTGQFVDSTVEGLRYVGSMGSTGHTTKDGEFTFKPGEVIQFYIGEKTLLGTAFGQGVVTPASLLENQVGHDDRKTNILRLLQSVDADGDPSNGIEITDTVTAALDERELDFDLPATEFENSDAVQNLLTVLSKSELVDADSAEEHFTYALNGVKTLPKPGFQKGTLWLLESTLSMCPEVKEVVSLTFNNGKVTMKGTEVEHKQVGWNEQHNLPEYGCVTRKVDVTASYTKWSEAFCGVSDCNTYAAMNGSREDLDSDGRLYLNWQMGSTQAKVTVRFRDDLGMFNGNSRINKVTKLNTSRDLLTEPTVDMTGTWAVILTDTQCPDTYAESALTFSAEGITGHIEEFGTKENGACSIESEEVYWSYDEAPDFLALGPKIKMSDLNRAYVNKEGRSPVFVRYNQDTKSIIRVKARGEDGLVTMTYVRTK